MLASQDEIIPEIDIITEYTVSGLSRIHYYPFISHLFSEFLCLQDEGSSKQLSL